ncbi:MAG TPA: hypothetical protein VJM57_03255 [Thermodesulfobacteriota bacterium]|nr:hypothetical protein [Thermodesulfobacteriota bacterium]
MKIYKLPQLADSSSSREFVLDEEAINTDAVYLLYGRLSPGESDREITPPDGYEEIIHVVKGTLNVRHGNSSFSVSAGEAFHPVGPVFVDNPAREEAVFTVAGGRSAARGGDTRRPGKKETKEAGKNLPVPAAEDAGARTVEAGEGEEYLITEE